MSSSQRPTPTTAQSAGPTARVTPTAAFPLRIADAFAYSSVLAAAVGASLTLAASLALDAPKLPTWIFLTASGTFIIYALDRLRDLDRDESTSPMRTAFVSRHRRLLYRVVTAVAISFAAVLLSSPLPVIALCMAVGVVGLFHRRLKHHPAGKAVYVSASWTAACVGLPWLASDRIGLGGWVSGVFLASLTANLIASNLRDNEFISVSGCRATALWAARAFALLGIGIAFVAPSELTPLAWVPACEGLALICFRPTERYSHLAIDGALLLGALATSLHLASLA